MLSRGNQKQHASLYTEEKPYSCKIFTGKHFEDTYGNTYRREEKYFFFARSVGQYFPEVVIWRDICKHILEQDFPSDNLEKYMQHILESSHLTVAVVLFD